ncbi:hypothetical protein CspeluHIS016_0902830 [Cutaneotrichosporon spelunceum]|uniref:Transmembrane protein n=1 Tax=Cutaneotrichosporon spelunceum TaxID=1672016 RepID=A0AAD3YED5_9TREE|nr:hypothetical protein CspeluHIS016_0902830 [Cutaneotrichosporon spelunceum]
MTSASWPPSESDTSWSPLSEADSPGPLSPLPSLALEEMDSSALPVSSGESGVLSGALGVLSSGALRPLEAQVQAWRMPSMSSVSVGDVGHLQRREAAKLPTAPLAKMDATRPGHTATEEGNGNSSVEAAAAPPATPPTPWDVVLGAYETTRALGYVPGTLFALLVLPHLLTFAMVCAAANVVCAAFRAVGRMRLHPIVVAGIALAAVYLFSRWGSRDNENDKADLRDEIARNALFMAEVRHELAVLRGQIKETNRQCAGASRFVGTAVRERCKKLAEESRRVR